MLSYLQSEPLSWYGDSYDHGLMHLGFGWRDCPFCASKMWSITDEKERFVLAHCEICGFWRVVSTDGLGSFHTSRELSAHRGVAKLFQIDGLDVPLSDLKRFLRQNPAHLAHVNPYAFEDLVADCLRAAFPQCDLVNVGGRHDRGIDIILIQTTGERYLVQIKRRSNIEKNESVDVVRYLNGVIFRENAAKGLVVTTARNYTPDAQQETLVQSDTGVWQSIDLYGFQDIVEWLGLPNVVPITRGSRSLERLN
jgi:HJR/Mrr/RecB family endonuclease